MNDINHITGNIVSFVDRTMSDTTSDTMSDTTKDIMKLVAVFLVAVLTGALVDSYTPVKYTLECNQNSDSCIIRDNGLQISNITFTEAEYLNLMNYNNLSNYVKENNIK